MCVCVFILILIIHNHKKQRVRVIGDRVVLQTTRLSGDDNYAELIALTRYVTPSCIMLPEVVIVISNTRMS